MPSALIVEDDASSRQALVDFVRTEGFEPTAVDSVRDALTAISAEPDVVLCDLVLPDGLGTELLPAVRERPLMEFVFVTGKATVESAIEALRGGASDYLKKPVDVRRLKALLANVRRRLDLQAEIVSLRGELRDLGRFGELIGASSVMQETYTLIERVAPTSAPVFLSGESGTGKELTALTLHRLSQRRGKTFLPINCGAISPTLMESELFGHEKGSFTGAGRQHRGYFERASGGTLFLDEISEMSLELQVKLLRVLETGALSRVGGDRTVPVDVRIVAASNRNPEQAIADGRLREDLYYRLNVFPIRLPPVRDRVGDVELLAESFLVRLNRGEGRQKRFSAAALEALARYDWPGNVREVKNAVERAFILADDTLDTVHFPPEISDEDPRRGPSFTVRVGSTISDVERRLILATLEQLDGNRTKAAGALGISVKTLYNRLNEYARRERDCGPDEAVPLET